MHGTFKVIKRPTCPLKSITDFAQNLCIIAQATEVRGPHFMREEFVVARNTAIQGINKACKILKETDVMTHVGRAAAIEHIHAIDESLKLMLTRADLLEWTTLAWDTVQHLREPNRFGNPTNGYTKGLQPTLKAA